MMYVRSMDIRRENPVCTELVTLGVNAEWGAKARAEAARVTRIKERKDIMAEMFWMDRKSDHLFQKMI
jgi:hypothetical protein